MLCMDCKYEHECPYMTDQDMVHAMMDGGEEVYKLVDKVRELLEQLKERIKEDFKMSKDFGFGIELAGCKGFKRISDEESKESIDVGKVDLAVVLLRELYRLDNRCRSKVGVRVPFDTYDMLIKVLELYVPADGSNTFVSKN